MFENILATLDTPLYCNESVLSGGQLAQFYNSKLSVLHVLQSDSPIYRNYVKHFQTGEEIVADDHYTAMVKKEIERNCSSVLKSCSNCNIIDRKSTRLNSSHYS